MIEYKYQRVKGLSGKKFLENGHTMFEEDVLQRLKRLAHLEEQIGQGQLLPIDIVIERFSGENLMKLKLLGIGAVNNCECKNLPEGEIAISSKALTDPEWKG